MPNSGPAPMKPGQTMVVAPLNHIASKEDMAMTRFDLSPLFRTSVGFDRMARLFDSIANEQAPSYPPYNIERTDEDAYRISMAVAGFGEDDLEVTVEDNQLIVAGRIKENDEDNGKRYLHRGIAERAFERRFGLADHIQVAGGKLENGLLHVDLVREVPEEMKPRQIKIGTAANKANEIEGKAA